jgi:TetR/AcrR family fatty acid metabolism transcriptional regulator
MDKTSKANIVNHPPDRTSLPPAGIKIAQALRSLIKDKDFNSITTAEISRVAGVNESLIYRYFGDKRGLIHFVLTEYMNDFYSSIKLDLKGIKGAINKIRKFVWASIHYYDADRVFSKILLLEVRNFPGYFESETYQIVKQYAGLLLEIIEEGIQSGSIRDDIAPSSIRQFILGTIEHHCLPAIIFEHQIDNDVLADNLSKILFNGIVKKK